MTVEIVILAILAAALGLKLYSVLGRRAEHGDEQPQREPMQGRFDAQSPTSQGSGQANANQSGQGQSNPPRLGERRDEPAAAGAVRTREPLSVLPTVERGLREIIAVDRRFDPHAFLEGARGAYGIVLSAFWRGDKDEIAKLCDAEVSAGFAAAIDARLAAGEVIDNRLVRLNEVVITGAEYEAPFARITVRFVADIAAITRDAQGHVVAGSLHDAIEARDVWTFRRNINSADPDWLLDETDEA
ncbi:MAG: Tim44 domain-containing protein [Sphingomonadales bacterium]|nr:Tim44 domain-containing protein [Sphingomonadales bacterium]MDE2168677.1 Tim44 domain-containing protein [Sphingomonadales bacterium]